MRHKAGGEFFEKKLPWSKRKDRILGSYLNAYLPKIYKGAGSAILVDGFAGPGKFNDGTPGSPLIMAELIQKNNSKSTTTSRVNHQLIVSEPNRDYYKSLENTLAGFGFVEIYNQEFCSIISRIESLAARQPMFIYLDPFGIKGVDLIQMSKLFELASKGNSIEIFMNVNVFAFARAALSNIMSAKGLSQSYGDDEFTIAGLGSTETLNSYAGGDWWAKCVVENDVGKTLKNLLATLIANLQNCFAEVCFHEVHSSVTSTIPKYVLVFGSRHPDALVLMNDEMVKSRDVLVESSRQLEATLFETLPLELVPDRNVLDKIVWESLPASSPGEARKDVIYKSIRSSFGQFLSKDYRAVIEELLKSGKVLSETGNTRINNDVKIWKSHH